jgi:diguanylate cyclase (GGDEF)-like protein
VIAALLDATRRCAESGLPMRLQDAVELEVAPQRASFVEASFAPLASHGGRAGCVLVLRDVTSQRALALELAYQASHDELTGLINRREFEARLAGAAAGETPHALMYLDLDRFKVVNDTCGHAAGDALLRELGGSLRAAAPQEATVARLGGDEFGVLLPCADDRVAARAAEALRVAVERLRFRWGERSFRIGVSIGLVPVARDATVAELLAAADTACYAAKDAGRNRVHAGDSNDAELRRRRDELGWVARLHAALDAGRFALWRQPIRALDGGGEHHEMLLRMHDEQGRLVLPGEFIPAAERHGLMPELDRWVVEHACAWLARTPEAGMHALNLSGQTLSDLGFHAFVSDALARHDVAPARLCFEITETAAIRQPECALESIQALRAAGCRFALDDFGSGLASFAYLKRLPVDLLKIDGAFVRRIHEDPVDRELVRAANGLAHLMGMRTVAEYAESEAVLAVLRELGVDYAQGYAIGRPEPLPEA